MGGGDYNNILNINELEKDLGYDDVHRRWLGSFEDDGNGNSPDQDDDDRTVEDEDDESGSNVSQVTGERTIYWDSQEAMLQEILEHYSSTGTKLRKEISRLIETAKNEEETATNSSCKCRNPKKSDGCAKCFRQRVVNLLCQKGFNASLCTSTWSSTNNFPGGTHEYIEVIASTQSRKKKITFLIEVLFQDEFKMAKASEEYHALTDQLPEIFIGKSDHLNAIVRVICDAAKRSTAEMRMHLGPWRKRSFMQRKWSASEEKPSLSINNYASKILGPVTSAGEEQVGFKCGFQFSAAAAVRVA